MLIWAEFVAAYQISKHSTIFCNDSTINNSMVAKVTHQILLAIATEDIAKQELHGS